MVKHGTHFLLLYSNSVWRETMKTVILALLVSLAVSEGDALICHCQQTTCTAPVETCVHGTDPVCAKILVSGSSARIVKGCMSGLDDCLGLHYPPYYFAMCCSTDLCN